MCPWGFRPSPTWRRAEEGFQGGLQHRPRPVFDPARPLLWGELRPSPARRPPPPASGFRFLRRQAQEPKTRAKEVQHDDRRSHKRTHESSIGGHGRARMPAPTCASRPPTPAPPGQSWALLAPDHLSQAGASLLRGPAQTSPPGPRPPRKPTASPAALTRHLRPSRPRPRSHLAGWCLSMRCLWPCPASRLSLRRITRAIASLLSLLLLWLSLRAFRPACGRSSSFSKPYSPNLQ